MELSREEAAFVARKLQEAESREAKPASRKRRRRSKHTPLWRRASSWAVGLLAVPVALVGVFAFTLYRLEHTLGAGTVEWLSHEELPEGFLQAAEAGGMGWLPLFLEVYSKKELLLVVDLVAKSSPKRATPPKKPARERAHAQESAPEEGAESVQEPQEV